MDDAELAKQIGSAVGGGVVSGALLIILYRVASKIIERLIAAIDRLAARIDASADRMATRMDDHSREEWAHHHRIHRVVRKIEDRLAGDRRSRDDDDRLDPPDTD